LKGGLGVCYVVEKLHEIQKECRHREDHRIYLFDEIMGIEWYCNKCSYTKMINRGGFYEPRQEV